MHIAAVLAPVFALVLLTFVVMMWMARARIGALRAGQVRMGDIALGQTSWPPKAQQVSNNYASQFQMPVLFYVLVALALITRHADFLFVVMSWLFVLTRLVHTYIHTTSNYVRYRFNAFAAGALILLVMWIIFAVDILLGLP